jgi:DNA-binding transcriptional MerR regulator
MPERAYLSIGEVLSLLKDEFADITISKIRFLESQGLLDPERTPSGYRKFYEADVERLRWILRQQREHFLPLKVIKGRLGADDDEADRATGGVVTAERLEAARSLPPEPSAPADP